MDLSPQTLKPVNLYEGVWLRNTVTKTFAVSIINKDSYKKILYPKDEKTKTLGNTYFYIIAIQTCIYIIAVYVII